MLQQRREQQSVAPFARLEQESAEAQIRELELMEEAERSHYEDLAKSNPRLRVRLAESKLRIAEADRDMAQLGVQETIVTAPVSGTILRLQLAVGGLVAPGTTNPPVIMIPDGPLIVRAEVDQEFLPRIRPGMRATIQDENHLQGKIWSGRIRSIAKWLATRRSYVLDPGEINDIRTVECQVEFDSSPEDVWIGQQMRVRFHRNP
jgi:multidrug resistance efflux pump